MLVITNQIESTNDWKYSDSGTDIGIAIAWVMKSDNTTGMKCDEDEHFCFLKALRTNWIFEKYKAHPKKYKIIIKKTS